MSKKLTSPFSSGGGGFHFEAHIQASFVALMLTGGHAPCLPCWPIVEIKLQGKISGFETDDLVVVVEKTNTKERRKLLGQVKHSIAITKRSNEFGEVIRAAWNDFQNPKIFSKGKDILALITGPLSATDVSNVQWLLNEARHTATVNEFFRNVRQANFSPAKSREKLEVFQHHLKAANNDSDVSDEDLYNFLNSFHLLGYDLGNESGVVLPLLYSHISQFQQEYPQWIWSRAVDIVQTWNQDGGTITRDNLPDDLLEVFNKQKVVTEIPEELRATQEKPKKDWLKYPDATYLALIVLIGAWQDKNQYDTETVASLLGISYDEWIKKAPEILDCPDTPLSITNGTWKVANRAELWKHLGSRALDRDLNRFRRLAISVLGEADPAFELPAEDRCAANIFGKVPKCSHTLRKGIADGLAILGNQPEACSNCLPGKAEATCVLVIRELLTEADWVLWGSLNILLPSLAEAAPCEFLDAVESALHAVPCPFDELFSQEGDEFTGGCYLSGLYYALESLAWNEQYLVRVCVALAELDSHDPGGQWSNRPFNSLVNILLPWLPQTLASVDKRNLAVKTLLKECPDTAWNLIIQLLPDQHRISVGSHKPNWRKIIPDNWKKGVTQQEYWQQVSFYSELAVAEAGQDVFRLSTLITHFHNLSPTAREQLLETLASKSILGLPEEMRVLIFNRLTKLIYKHRRTPDVSLPNEIIARIEYAAKQLAPANPFNLYQHLFSYNDTDLYEDNSDWKEQQKKLDSRRETAIAEILQQEGVNGIIRFAKTVSSSNCVGGALAAVADSVTELALLPSLLEFEDKFFVSSFVWWRHHLKGWKWCDALDKSDWTSEQISQFLAFLPFTQGTWRRASEWLKEHEDLYWKRAGANANESDGGLAIAIDKLIEYGRPHAAINCLNHLLYTEQIIDINQCVRALLAATSSPEPSHVVEEHHITELIKFLQAAPSVNQDDLLNVEWAYIPILDRCGGATPKLHEHKLAIDPELFCQMVRLIYRPKKGELLQKEYSEEAKAIAANAWKLLHNWKIPPGTQQDGTFSEENFTKWLQRIKEISTDSGHLDVALVKVGEVLIHAPPDHDGLWIHRAAADALNDKEAENMRDGFETGIYNSRGFHWVDPTGTPEKELAEQWRTKAEAVENAGFQRFAAALRQLAKSYDREAERVIAQYKQECE